jgi:hypothetical protein
MGFVVIYDSPISLFFILLFQKKFLTLTSTKSSSGNASPLALHGNIAHSKCPEESQQG